MENANIDLNRLIQEAEVQQQLLTAQSVLEKNLNYFQSAAPELYQAFHNYVPSHYQLGYTAGHWDIFNLDTKQYLYQKDPITYCQNSVTKFLNKPYCYRISIIPNKGYNTDHEAHIGNINPMLNGIEEAMAAHPEPHKPPIGKDCPFLIVNGIGLGYHLSALMQNTCIHHLCVVEPEPDFIFASLHTIDWQFVCEEFNKPGRSINLVLAQSPSDGAEQLLKHVNDVGLFNTVKTYQFSHLTNEALTQTTDVFLDLIKQKIGGIGYFDDERIGFAHTLVNIKNSVPVIDFAKPFPPAVKQQPVIVVANGPSLDKAKEVLLKNHHNAIVISCGTALGSLYQMGIKPDIHVEMERNRPVIEWIEETTDPDYIKDIFLLSINTSHPDLFGLFERHAIAIKTNDIGSFYLLERLHKIILNSHLDRCNPTVANAGIAFASSLGFTEIYLLGLDLGFTQSGQHHSKYSAHYRVKDEAVEHLNIRDKDADSNVVLPGNFGGEVVATPIFASAKENVRKLLRDNPNINCYNAGEGVFIEGAKPTPMDSLNFPKMEIDKAKYIDEVISTRLLPDLSQSIPSHETIRSQVSAVTTTLENLNKLLRKSCQSKSECWALMQSIHNEARELKKATQYGSMFMFIRGSVDAFLLVLARSLYIYTDESDVLKEFTTAKQYITRFVNQAKSILESGLFDLDVRNFNLSEKLEK